ncbi:hypothetical protein [Paractinoplanes hotanensis]|uniref:MBL fold metallo-hydrolase n=1 Tax=Paractinoplanes hotanensis TaxID=2906497 RepID=A0ABT0YFD0_9ACTN|nr:hypothetical protein [Actinoplanes hotanensis]MCM4084763.1 hypothetical protein [Actinoplanes hotanensis]
MPETTIEPIPCRIRGAPGPTVVADSGRALLLDEISDHGFPDGEPEARPVTPFS